MKKRVIAIGLTLAMLISSGTNVSYTEAKGKTARKQRVSDNRRECGTR